MSEPASSTLADDLDHLATSIGGDDPMGIRDELAGLADLARSLSQDVALAAGDLAHLIGPYDAALGRIAVELCRVAGRLARPPSKPTR
jgi:hypothetical protein